MKDEDLLELQNLTGTELKNRIIEYIKARELTVDELFQLCQEEKIEIQSDALNSLGVWCSKKEDGLFSTYREAFILYKFAAERGNSSAMRNLATYYFRGTYGAKNLDLALKWCQEAISKGLIYANFLKAKILNEQKKYNEAISCLEIMRETCSDEEKVKEAIELIKIILKKIGNLNHIINLIQRGEKTEIRTHYIHQYAYEILNINHHEKITEREINSITALAIEFADIIQKNILEDRYDQSQHLSRDIFSDLPHRIRSSTKDELRNLATGKKDDDYCIKIFNMIKNHHYISELDCFSDCLFVLGILNFKQNGKQKDIFEDLLIYYYERKVDDPIVRFCLGHIHLAENKYERAEYQFKNISDMHKDVLHPNCNIALAECFVNNNRFHDALRYYKKCNSVEEQRVFFGKGMVHFNRAKTDKAKENDYEEAKKYFLCITDKNSNYYNIARLRLSDIFEKGGFGVEKNEDDMVKYLKEASELDSEEAIKKLIHYFTRVQNPTEAQHYQNQLGLLDEKKSRLQYAINLYQREETQLAEPIFIEIISSQGAYSISDIESSHYYLGLCYLKLNQNENAEKYFKYVTDKFRNANYHLFVLEVQSEKYTEAIKYGKNYLEKNILNDPIQSECQAEVLFKLGACYEKTENTKESIVYYLKAAKCDSPLGFKKIVALYESEGLIADKADIALEIALISIYQDRYLNIRTDLLSKTPLNIKAILQFSADKKNSKAQYQLGKLLLDENNELQKAHQLLEEAASQKNIDAMNLLGEIAHDKSPPDWKTAIKWYKEALEIDSTNKESNAQLTLIKNQVITKLLYEAKRHRWEDNPCTDLREILGIIEEELASANEKQLDTYIENEERKNHTFYGLELSDDSDSDEEEHFKKCSNLIRASTHKHSYTLFNKADYKQVEEKLKKIIQNENAFELERQILEPSYAIASQPKPSPSILSDLKELNYWRRQGKLEEGLKKITNFFLIAQHRGITYKTTDWNKVDRRAHRQFDEINKPLFFLPLYMMEIFNIKNHKM